MSVKSCNSDQCQAKGQIVRSGYVKKLKTSRRKWFVLRAELDESPACLEYYDSEKKFVSGQPPKKSIPIKTCFNINKRKDTKHKNVVALYTKDEVFCLLLESPEEADSWLKSLWSLQYGADTTDGETPKPTYVFVWLTLLFLVATVCLDQSATASPTHESLEAIRELKKTLNRRSNSYAFTTLTHTPESVSRGTILDCANLYCASSRIDKLNGEKPKLFSFRKKNTCGQVRVVDRGIGTNIIGNYSLCLKEKNLKLIKKESNIIVDMNLTNVRSCGHLKEYVLCEVGRSSSLGPGELWMEAGDENIANSIYSTIYHAMSSNSSNELGPKSRNRSSSATESSKPNPNYRKQNMPKPNHLFQQDPNSIDSQVPPIVTTSSSTQHSIVSGVASIYHHLIQRGATKASERRHSISAGGLNWSGNICHQRTQSLPLAHPTTTTTAPTFTDQNTTTTSHPLRANKRSSKCTSGGGRERCDSMPTRPRTTSEGNHTLTMFTKSLLPPYRSSHNRDISHSPPSDSPVSPPSVGCSTESSGSCYSLADEQDVNQEVEMIGRHSHPLTPDEAIAEEDSPDSPYGTSNYMSMIPTAPASSDDGYVDMWPRGRTHSMNSVTSGTPSTDMRFCEFALEKVSSYFPADDSDARPTRAYSVGSRPETYHSKRQMELAGTPENSRVRAFSVGSKKGPCRVLHHHPHTNAKSSSAPILSGRTFSSHSSIGPMDDLMEMDFSQPHHGVQTGSSDYMDMKPGSGTPSGYVEMKPGGFTPADSPYVDMSGSSPAMETFVDTSRLVNDYMDMKKPQTQRMGSSPLEPFDFNNYTVKKVDRHGSFSSSYYSASPKMTDSWVNGPTAPEGYMEMTVGGNKHQRQSSFDSAQVKHDDYADMSMGRRKPLTSQPIAIQGRNLNNFSSSPSSISPHQIGRKYSTGTPPSLHLPLSSQCSTIPRPRSRKNSRRDSKDSSSSSVTTPSNSSAIFSMSPCSPVKPITKQIKVPASVLNTPYKSSSVSLSEDYTMMDFERTPKKPDSSEYVNYNPAPKPKPQNDNAGDYAIMKPGTVEEKKVAASTLASKIFSMGFHPINDNMRTSPRPGDTVPELSNSTESIKETARSRTTDGSRPSSTSSELCSSTSTLTPSRPESVNSDRVAECARPASVSCDGQLHYASLDLAPVSDDMGNRSPRTSKSTVQPEVSGCEPTFTYAQIDFVKSEGLKHNSLPNNAKVKH